MNTQVNRSIKDLEKKRVPICPAGTQHLLQSLTDESLYFQEISLVIEKFPTISARLLALANSAWSAPLSPVTALDVACSRLGLNVVRSTCIALLVASPFNATLCPFFSGKVFWGRALLVAEVASWLAENCRVEVAVNTARTSGVLHNFGLLLLADQLPQEIQQALSQHDQKEGGSLSQILTQHLGYDYAAAGAFIGESWGIPPLIVNSIREHLSTSNITDDINASIVSHACTMVQAAEQQSVWTASDAMTSSLQISAEDAERIFSKIGGQMTKTHELAEILFRLI